MSIFSLSSYLVLLLFSLTLSSCGSGEHSTSADTGSASFGLKFEEASAPAMKLAPSAAPADICSSYGIEYISGTVYNSSNSAIATGGPWACADHQGTIYNIPPGSNLRITIKGTVSGTVVWQGETTGATIYAGQDTNVGSIPMTYTGNDTTRPTVTAATPTGTNVPLTSPITVTFSEYMAASTIDTTTFTLKNGSVAVAGSVSYNSTTKTATFTPTSSLSNSVIYTATVTTDVTDMAANKMQSLYTWDITTEAPPTSAPTTPTSVTATAADKQVTVSWTAVSGATSYNIYWSNTTGVTKTNGTLITGATSPYIHTALTNGTTYYYVVTAVNSYGESGESSQVSAMPTSNTIPDITAPMVSSTSPANNAIGFAVNTAITATFSEIMTASTINTSTFTVNGVTGTVTYSGTTATFTPSSNLAYSTTYTATITTGVKDLADNAMVSNYTWSFTTGTAPDTTPPIMSSTSPANSATGVAVNTAITATFSETMTASTINTSTFTINGVTGTVTYSGTTATFTPSANLAYYTAHIATISTGVKDAAGNTMASNYTWSFTTTPPSPGSLDTTFGTGGKVTTDFGSSADYANALGIQSDGKIVAAGSSYNGSNGDFAVVRYNTDGTLDTTFGTGGKVTTDTGVSDVASALGIQSDGRIVAAGHSQNGSYANFALLRYDTSGTLDTTFGTSGKVATAIGSSADGASAVAIQSDGKIVAAGNSYNGANNDFALARYNTDGTLDTAFGIGGKVTTAIGSSYSGASALGIQSDGKIVAAGVCSGDDFALVRYNTDGSLDATFGTDGKVTTDIGSIYNYATALSIQSDGKIVAAGRSYYSSNFYFTLVRYNTDGTLDTTFGTGGKVNTDGYGQALGIQSDGKIVSAGISPGAINNDFVLFRYNTDGSLDTTFGTSGKVITTSYGYGSLPALGIQSDGKIVAAGGANDDFTLVRYWP